MSRALLLMAYGSPENPADVEPYFTHIRGGRRPSPEAVARLQRRYEIVGGRTPLLDITLRLRTAVAREFGSDHVYVGMKHWHPFIHEVVPRIAANDVTELVAIALAPHYSRLSIGGYRAAVERAVADLPGPLPVRFVDSWHLQPHFIELVAQRACESLAEWPASERGSVVTLFSAHSLPTRIREWEDPYERQLLESCHAVASRAGIDYWRFAWQSAGDTGEPWLGPDIVEVLQCLHADGVRHVLSVPIGFVSEHLEVFYDIDVEARRAADALGMTLRRSRMPNDDPLMVRAISTVARQVARQVA